MQLSWLAIALTTLVVVVGAVVGIRQNGGTVQRRATALSFAVLAVMGVISCVVIPLLGLSSLVPLFSLVSFILPLVLYAAVVATADERAHAMQPRTVRLSSTKPSHVKAAYTKPQIPPMKENEGKAAVSFISSYAETPREQVVTAVAPAQTLAAKSSYVPTSISPASKEVLPKRAAHSEDAGECGAVISYPPPLGEVKPKYSKPASQPSGLSSEKCFSKAVTLKEKGAHAVAARLFAESAALAGNESGRRRARFEELACYVKANQFDRAQALASDLSEQSHGMTKVERIKLDAVTRML